MISLFDNLDYGVCRIFSSESTLRRWLENKNQECGSSEAFSKWLQNYFDDGNEISVYGDQYDFWSCWELL